MEKQFSKNVRLGIFVLAGTAFLIFVLYMIGDKRNLFDSSIRVIAKFRNANGLMSGNSVRFAGINIGTVESVNIISDSLVQVDMRIEKKVIKHIKKNSIASVGTDGLMGNKLVNILSVLEQMANIEEGDELKTYKAIETTEMLKTLHVTNENVRLISEDLKKITSKVNNSNSLWNLLSDTVMGHDVKKAILEIRSTGENTSRVSADLVNLVSHVKNGQGVLGALLVDSVLSNKIKVSVKEMESISKQVSNVSKDLSLISSNAKKGEGAIGVLLADSVLESDLLKSMENIKKGTGNFNENMEALKRSIFLRKYFKKKNKK